MTTYDEPPADYDAPPPDDFGGSSRGGRDGGGREGGRNGGGAGRGGRKGGRDGGGFRDGGGGNEGGRQAFDRVPPQDIAAEQGVLGGMMLSKDAIADVVEVIKGTDFYRPAHEIIYEAILDLYSRGEPADPVTVSAELTNKGELTRVGGTPYLHDLISTVPTAANAAFYARIVGERAVLRRLVEAGTRIVQMGYGADGMDVEAVVNSAQAEMYAVSEKRTKEDYAVLGDVVEGAIDEIEASSHRGEGMVGVPTGFADLDGLTNGLHPGQMIVIAARPAVGKALALDTPLPTPTGWTTMGEVAVGDQLVGADGQPTTVVAATEVMLDRPCYEVHFSDGSVIVADGQHQWVVETADGSAVRTTEGLDADLRSGLGVEIAVTQPVASHQLETDASPYLFGARMAAWFGDRALDIDLDALLEDGGEGFSVLDFRFLQGSVAQRLRVVAGYLDARATVRADGQIEFDGSYADDIRGLLHGLGVPTRREGGSVTVSTDRDLFTVESKALQHKVSRVDREVRHVVVSVNGVDSVPVRCVEVSNEDHLYLAGRSMIPTHNSTLGLDIARACSIKHGLASVIFSLEMGRNEIAMRLLSAEARVPLQKMRKGTMDDADWTRFARTMGSINEAPLYIDDSPNMSLMEIRSKCRRLKQRADLKLVIVDYLQLMTSGKKVESRQQEVSEFSRALKLLAKEIEVPVIALSQLNRGPEQRTDKRPMVSDLRESGCLTADTRVLRADTGAEITMEELYALQMRDVPVWALDESLRYVRRHLTHVFPTGEKPVFRLRTASGKEVRATANHPFLTSEGWKPLGELAAGDRLGVPRHVPAPERVAGWTDDQVVLLARLLGGGTVSARRPVRYRGGHQAGVDAVFDAAVGFGCGVRSEGPGLLLTTGTGAPHPVREWFDDLGILGETGALPAEVFHLPKRQIATFLAHLWAESGLVLPEPGVVRFAHGSRQFLDGLARLLLRFGIAVDVRPGTAQGAFPHGWTLEITGRDELRRFLQEIGVNGRFAAESAQLLADVRGRTSRRPVRLGEELASVFAPTGALAAAAGRGLAAVVDVLDEAELDVHAVNDVVWDEIIAIEADGVEQVFDATVAGGHNFVANGIAVHNSIEQDADMVILLHREDMYEKESPRAGEADFIVAKHRNGPTDTITVAFQGHYSRFVDMAT